MDSCSHHFTSRLRFLSLFEKKSRRLEDGDIINIDITVSPKGVLFHIRKNQISKYSL